MFTEEQKEEIKLLEALKGACCTSNNLQMKLEKMSGKPGKGENLLLEIDFKECGGRMKSLMFT